MAESFVIIGDENLTFEDALELLIREFEKDVEQLKIIHKDLNYVNSETSKYRDLLKDLAYIGDEIFKLKGIRRYSYKLLDEMKKENGQQSKT